MAKRTARKTSACSQVIVSVSGGVADVLFKPRGVSLSIFDYDMDGVDAAAGNLSKDADGKACCISEWPAEESVICNKHWPMIRTVSGRVDRVDARNWRCPTCQRRARCSYDDLAEAGTPHCPDCDRPMQMI
jgi:hypothetical protein